MDNQTKLELYEQMKHELQSLNLDPDEYEKRLKEYCEQIKF